MRCLTRSFVHTLTSVTACLSLVSMAHAQNLLINGDFEDPAVHTQIGFVGVNPGETTLTGWDVGFFGQFVPGGSGIEIVDTFWTANTGQQSLDLNGGAPGSISQSVVVAPDALYDLSFALAGNPSGSPLVKTLSLDWLNTDTGESLFSKTLSVTAPSGPFLGGPLDWGLLTFRHLHSSNSGHMTLRFISTTINTDAGPALDSVVLTPSLTSVAPEPSALTLLLIGMCARRRKRIRRSGSPVLFRAK